MKLFLFSKTENMFIRIIKNVVVYCFGLSFVCTLLKFILPSFTKPLYIFISLCSIFFCISLCILAIYTIEFLCRGLWIELKEDRDRKKSNKQQEILEKEAKKSTFLFKHDVLELTKEAVKADEFCDLLCGNGKYRIPDREGFSMTNRGAVLYSGIHPYFKKDKTIKSTFENALIKLSGGSCFEIMTAFSYIWRQYLSELNQTAPFLIDNMCVQVLKQSIEQREVDLKNYKELCEFGGTLANGAWEYIKNMNEYFENEYGKNLFE